MGEGGDWLIDFGEFAEQKSANLTRLALCVELG